MDSARVVGRRYAVAAALVLGAGQALAATIYGSLTAGGQPLAGADLVLECGSRGSQGKTDARGAFRFTVDATGTCELRVAGASAKVIVYKEPTRYDFEVRRSGSGASLVRK